MACVLCTLQVYTQRCMPNCFLLKYNQLCIFVSVSMSHIINDVEIRPVLSKGGTVAVRTDAEGQLAGPVWRAVQFKQTCLIVWGEACIPEQHAVDLPVGLRHPTSLLSMVMNGDAGMGTFSLCPLAPSLSPRTLISMAAAAITWL